MNQKKTFIFITVILLLFAAFFGLKNIIAALKKETAYQFVVDGEKWFTVSRKDTLEKMLDRYQQQYLSNVDKRAQVKKIVFSQAIEIIEVKVSSEEIDTIKFAKEKIYAVEEDAIEIEVKRGDNLWDISRSYHISVDELEALNPLIDSENIHPGDKLVVKPLNPKLDVVVELENTITEAISFNNEYQKTSRYYKNYRKTVRKGNEGKKETRYNITLLNGYQTQIEIKQERILKEPVNALIQIGTKSTVSRDGRVNYGVVSGKRISSLYGYRIHPITGRRRFHSGLDIAASQGNEVYAYTDGKIVQAGWNGGYGLTVLVDHGNGLKTRYAHLSKIYVRVGQKVATGATIGAVGSTGNSTGPHLHFEVLKWGLTKNPLNYI